MNKCLEKDWTYQVEISNLKVIKVISKALITQGEWMQYTWHLSLPRGMNTVPMTDGQHSTALSWL